MLLSSWFLALLIGLASSSLFGWVALEVRRFRRRRLGRPFLRRRRALLARAGALLLVVVLSAAAAADGVNRHFGYIPTMAALMGNVSPDLDRRPQVDGNQELALGPAATGTHRLPAHGVVQKVTIPGTVSGVGNRTGYVYLPPAYFDSSTPDRRFPVLYLIHGSPGTAVDWLRGGYVDRTMDQLLRKGRIEPFIVVLPDVNGGYGRDVECEDVVGGPHAQTYLVTDVVGWVDSRYRTLADRSDRAIGGLSTGGYCGINLTFRHQDVFSAAVSHSGYGRPDRNRYTGDLFGGSNALADANTPDFYLPTIPLHLPIGVYMDAGSADTGSRTESTRLFEMFRKRGVTVSLEIVAGESHTFVAFRQNLELSLPWVSRWFEAQGAVSGVQFVAAPDASYLPPPSPADMGRPRRRCSAAPRPTSQGTTPQSSRVVASQNSGSALPARPACRAPAPTTRPRTAQPH